MTAEPYTHSEAAGHDGDGDGGAGALGYGYSPNQEQPLRAYMVLLGVYATAVGGSALAVRASGRGLPERPSPIDVVLIGVATHKLSRLIAKDRITSFIRAPFTRFQQATGHGEVSEQPRGHGLRLVMGEMLVCPYCLAQWVATGMTVGLVLAPRLTRTVSAVFVAHTISDFLQLAYRAGEEQV